MELLAFLLGKLLGFCYSCINDYLLTIVVFTLITKAILLPVNIIVQKNSIKMVRLTPEINNLKCDYYGDNDKINDETLKLYKREKYSPFISLIPLIIQLVLLMGVIEVVKDPSYSGISEAQMVSFGIDHSLVPCEHGGMYIFFPVAAALSSLLMCIVQNRSQVLQAEQGKLNKYGMTAFSVLLSLYLGFFVKAGVAAYWIFGNIFGIAQTYLLNAIIDPKKYVDYEALDKSRKRLEELKNHGAKLTPEMKKRQRADYKRFFSVENKHLVFYSESSGFYKYFRRLIEWLTTHSNVKIHYITGDPDDIIFSIAENNKQIIPYFIGENKLISLFLKMDAQIVVMTMPDLENYHIKRSYVKKDIEYIYIDHGMSSDNLTLRKGALDHFDTIFCAGEHICEEVRATEKYYGLPEKNLVKYGYGLLEDLTESYNEWKSRENCDDTDKFILLAPSHQKDNILDSCLETVVEGLKRCARVIIRPHPQYVRRYPEKWSRIVSRYSSDELVSTESSFASNEVIYKAALVVSDWSNIYMEYAFSSLRPVLLINTPMKVINPDYKAIDIEPIDISIRSKVGIEVSGKDPDEVFRAADMLINHNCISSDDIRRLRDRILFGFMHSSETGGKYILSRLVKNGVDNNEK
ncbi:membrane protein insertase YidC [Huintestinicola sp.]|uniref:membrane protein insertase YidC n=1 Tax=Huintestinicola sp. TaxID=2981661 RepID=UPI003D7D8603